MSISRNQKIGAVVAGVVVIGGGATAYAMNHNSSKTATTQSATPHVEQNQQTTVNTAKKADNALKQKGVKVQTVQQAPITHNDKIGNVTVQQAAQNIQKQAIASQRRADFQATAQRMQAEVQAQAQVKQDTSLQTNEVTWYSEVQTGSVHTRVTGLNIRSGASLNSPVIASVAKGSNLQVLGHDGNWYLIKTSNGVTGFVDGAFLNIHQVQQDTQSTAPVSVRPIVNNHNYEAPQEGTSVKPEVVHTSATPNSNQTGHVSTSNKDNIASKPNTVKPNGNGGEIVNLPQPAQINGNGGTSQNMPNVPQININPGNQGSGESNQPQGGQPSQGGQNTPAPSQGQGNQPQHQVKPEQPAPQGGQAHKGEVKPSVKPEQGQPAPVVPEHHQDVKPEQAQPAPVVKPQQGQSGQSNKPVVKPSVKPEQGQSGQSKPAPVVKPSVKPEQAQPQQTKPTVKPVQQQVTKTVLEVETLCNGKEVKGATYCILGTGKYEGQNFTTNGKEMVLTLDSADVTGANLTILPNGYGFVNYTTNKVVSVKDGVRTIKVVTELKVDKANEPQHQVKPEQPQSGQGNSQSQGGKAEHGQSQSGAPSHKTDVKPQPAPIVKPEHQVKPQQSKPVVKPQEQQPQQTKPVVKPQPAPIAKPQEQQPVHHETVKPVTQYGTINIIMKDTQGNLIGQEQTAKGVVGSADTLSMPTIPAGYQEVSMTVNGTSVNSLPSKFEAGTQNVVIIVKKLDAPVKVVFECNGTPLTTETHMMKVGSELNDSLIPTSLSKHYTIDSITVDGQATGKTISGTVQEGDNVIVVNLTKKAVAPTGWTANSQAFHQAVEQEFGRLLNAERAKGGESALQLNSTAVEVAQLWSNHQAETNNCEDLSTSNATSAIQNTGLQIGLNNSIATAVRTTTGLTQHDADKLAQQIFEAWMNSPIHRGTMNTTSYKEYGFAFTVNANGSVYGSFVTTDLNMSGIDFGN